MIGMANENALVLINAMMKTSIEKNDMAKYLSLARIGRETSRLIGDAEAGDIFEQELSGYGDEIPVHRNINGTPIGLPIREIVWRIALNNNNMNAVTSINGRMYRLKTLNQILLNFESYMWSFIGKALSDMAIDSNAFPALNVDMSGIPAEIAKMLEEFSE